MNNDEDKELVRLLAENLTEHFPAVVKRYTRKLWYYCRRHFVEYDGVDDVVQKTFTNAYFALQGFSQERMLELELEAWLFRIAYHECLKHLQKNKRGYPASSIEEISDWQSTIPSIDPWKLIEKLIDLNDAIEALLEPSQKIIRLYMKGFTSKEIARMLNMLEGTVKSHISRAKKQLRQKLDGLPPEEDNEGDENDA